MHAHTLVTVDAVTLEAEAEVFIVAKRKGKKTLRSDQRVFV
jgi:hypothetical protein